jgi:hypothetical protein
LENRARKLSLESQQKVQTICQQFATFLKSKQESFEYKSEDEVTLILNEYLINGILLPERLIFLVRNMSLIYLIVEFETFLKDALETTFERKPEVLTSCQKSITLEELLSCDELKSAWRKVFSKVSQEIVSRDVKEAFEYFGHSLGIHIQDYVNWREFFERFYRRNVLVHNEGITDKTYRQKTGYTGKNVALTVSERYLNETIALFDVVASKLSGDLQKKFHA